jgi:hypothetical protein
MKCPACGQVMSDGVCGNLSCELNGEAEAEGWEPTEPILTKTMKEWAEEYGVVIMDPDGFREEDREGRNLSGVVDPDRKYTEEDFQRRLVLCTVTQRP